MANVLQWDQTTNSFSVSGATSVTPVVGEGIDNNFSVAQTFGSGILQSGSAGTGNQSPLLNVGDAFSDFIADGMQWAIPSSASLTTDMTSGTAYLNSVRTLVPAVSGYSFPASNDTYVSFNNSGEVNYQSVANGATAPTPNSGYVKTAKVVTSPIQSPTPTLVAGTSGSLASGTYQVALVAYDATGYGAVGASGSVTVAASGSIDISWVNPLNETSMDIYATTAGSTTLGLVASGVTGTTYTYTGSVAPGAAAPTAATSNAVQTVTPIAIYGRLAQGGFSSTLNLFDFLTPEQIEDVMNRTLLYDVTTEVQSWLNALNYKKRGFAPAGAYKLTTQLNVDRTCEIFGDGYTTEVTDTVPQAGTVFVCTFDTSTAENVFLVTSSNVLFYNFEIFCNYQPVAASGWAPLTTPNSIQFYRAVYASTGGDDGRAIHLMLRGMSVGVFYNGADRGETELYGQTFGPMLLIDGSYDVHKCRLFHFWVFYSSSQYIQSWLLANGVGIYLGRVDNPQFTDVFMYGLYKPISYGPTNFSSGGSQRGDYANLGLDNCYYGIVVDSDGLVTMQIANLAVYCGTNGTSSSPSRGCFFTGSQVVLAQISNAKFTGIGGEAIRAEVSGSKVEIGNLQIDDYNGINNGFNALYAGSGVICRVSNPSFSTTNNGSVNTGGGGTFWIGGGRSVVSGNPGYDSYEAVLSGNVVVVTRNFGRFEAVATASGYTTFSVTLPVAYANGVLSAQVSLGNATSGLNADCFDGDYPLPSGAVSAIPLTLYTPTSGGGTYYIDWEVTGW